MSGYYDDVDGEELGDDMLGYSDVMGYDELIGAARNRRRGRRPAPQAARRALPMPPKPAWRNAIAPGVAPPGEGLEPMSLAPQAGGGVFTNVLTTIDFIARPQRPFLPERLIVTTGRSSGLSNAVKLLGRIYIGTDLAQLQLAELDLEVFAPNAFGVRLKLPQATPGMDVQITGRVSATPAVGESLTAAIMFLGRSIH